MDGVVHAALKEPDRFERVLRLLRIVFGFKDRDLRAAARRWTDFRDRKTSASKSHVRRRPPDIADLLSLLDVLISDETFVAGEKNEKDRLEPLSPRSVHRVRESISRAVATSFKDFAKRRPRGKTLRANDMFVSRLDLDDIVITTNWDLLLDDALDSRFGTDASSTGTDAIILMPSGERAPERNIVRPPLYKLHGSLNWLACARCTNLYVNPTIYIADLGFYRSARKKANTCECGMPLRPTLITPTYFKQYRLRHLANVWARAQHALMDCDDWYFIGYSLPSDDVHIKSLLLRAWHMRHDADRRAPGVHVVTNHSDDELLARFRGLFRRPQIDTSGFRAFASTM